MRIEILGRGCPKCQKTEEMIKATAEKLGVRAEIVHVTDIGEIIDRGVMMTPAVLVDGEKKIEGKIPTEAQVKEWLKE
ncbi:MAG TPA: thioredoxin family protein [Firmicutes bacterium]|nr:thioredoxin family protein [Bacillota bacterium]